VTLQEPGPATLSAKGTRLNRRGLETRRMLLDVAVRCLADGGPESVSANLVAREAGVTWGTVQHQFGDVDGLWAAVLRHVSGRRRTFLPPGAQHEDLGARVEEVVALVWDALDRPAVRAITNLRAALPWQRSVLEADFPHTAEALVEWDQRWEESVREAFAGFAVDPVRLRRVRSLLPGAVRGLRSEQYLSTYADMDDARRGLTEALTAYLS
jgi:AcrR family transcriptional regulator